MTSTKNDAGMATEVQIPVDCFVMCALSGGAIVSGLPIMCALSGGAIVSGLPISHISMWFPWKHSVTLPITQQIIPQLWEPGGHARRFQQI